MQKPSLLAYIDSYSRSKNQHWFLLVLKDCCVFCLSFIHDCSLWPQARCFNMFAFHLSGFGSSGAGNVSSPSSWGPMQEKRPSDTGLHWSGYWAEEPGPGSQLVSGPGQSLPALFGRTNRQLNTRTPFLFHFLFLFSYSVWFNPLTTFSLKATCTGNYFRFQKCPKH